MDRRQAIRRTAFIMGGSITGVTTAAIMSGCQPSSDDDWTPTFFNKRQIRTIAEICERIIPKTDTPGAKDVYVHRFVDEVIQQRLVQSEQDKFLSDLDRFEQETKNQFGKSFVKCSADQMDEILHTFAQKAQQEMLELQGLKNTDEISVPQRTSVYDEPDSVPFFFRMKELTFAGYFLSEEIGENILNYQPIPVDYQGCISVEEAGNGLVWSLS